MTTAQIIELDGTQAVRLPEEFRFASATVSIRKDGQAVVLESLKATAWPSDFYEAIHISNPRFARPPQGKIPLSPIEDDDPEWLKIERTPEFIASIAKACEQVRRGECVTHEQLLAELSLSAE